MFIWWILSIKKGVVLSLNIRLAIFCIFLFLILNVFVRLLILPDFLSVVLSFEPIGSYIET